MIINRDSNFGKFINLSGMLDEKLLKEEDAKRTMNNFPDDEWLKDRYHKNMITSCTIIKLFILSSLASIATALLGVVLLFVFGDMIAWLAAIFVLGEVFPSIGGMSFFLLSAAGVFAAFGKYREYRRDKTYQKFHSPDYVKPATHPFFIMLSDFKNKVCRKVEVI